MNETFLATALPYSASANAPFHVSVFFTLRLTPDAATGTLSDFPVTQHWASALAGAAITLCRDDGTTIPCTAVAAAQPSLWDNAFPPDTLVNPWQTPDPAAVAWKSFSAANTEVVAKGVHAISVLASPVDVGPVDNTNPLVAALTGQREQLPLSLTLRPGFWDEIDGGLTNQLDAGLVDVGVRPPIGAAVPTPSTAEKLLLTGHAVRRYYDRPEAQRTFHARPTPGQQTPGPPTPQPDFHQQVAHLGDLPALLRPLGLVVDLVIAETDLGLLADARWIQAVVEIEGIAQPPSQPKTSCRVVGRTFTSVASTPAIRYGRLLLGATDQFTVLDLDPDASGLKLDQYFRGMPRLAAAATNGDPVNAAPATLRAVGFGLAQTDRAAGLKQRLTGTPTHDDALQGGNADPLSTEQTMRGVRIQVWDSANAIWRSLHQRLLTVDVAGDPVFQALPDEGFLQGAALQQEPGDDTNPYYLHDVFAGWEGWSLSVPRPGKVILDSAGTTADAPPADPRTPVQATPKPAPGTLPMLRYGHSYSFRAFVVDLAGNSVPLDLEPTQGGPHPFPATKAAVAALRSATTARMSVTGSNWVLDELRPALRATASSTSSPMQSTSAVAPSTLPRAIRTGDAEVDAALARRLTVTAPTSSPLDRKQLVERAVQGVVAATSALDLSTIATQPVNAVSAALRAANLGLDLGPITAGDLPDWLKAVSTPKPLLRWDAVPPPEIVPRHRYTYAESLQRLVIRSGVELDPDGTVTITDPTDLAAAHPHNPDLRATSERHLAAPKTSQIEAERYGKFDTAIGSTDPALQKAAFATALRESGTFFDRTYADLAEPGLRQPQPGTVSLEHTATADTASLVTLDQIDADRGLMIAPGQYVVHDTDAMALPYLADPAAAGVGLRFPDALAANLLGLPAVEGVNLPYPSDWPGPDPFRLVLRAGPTLDATVAGNLVTITLPPGEQLRIAASSTIDPTALDSLGLAATLKVLLDIPIVREAALDGWLWWLSPSREIRLVHATQRPVTRPVIPMLFNRRAPAATSTSVIGVLEAHGPSTERLNLRAAWSEQLDDVLADGPRTITRTADVASLVVADGQNSTWLVGADPNNPPEPIGDVAFTGAVHEFGDTRARTIDYTAVGVSRYREFFPPDVGSAAEDFTLASEPRRMIVRSSARPARAAVGDVLPLFQWDTGAEPSQPFGVQRHRRSGVRLWLDRPWYSSGDGELLGVLYAPNENSLVLIDSVSLWAGDPVFLSAQVDRVALPLQDLYGHQHRRDTGAGTTAGADRLPAGGPGQRTGCGRARLRTGVQP